MLNNLVGKSVFCPESDGKREVGGVVGYRCKGVSLESENPGIIVMLFSVGVRYST